MYIYESHTGGIYKSKFLYEGYELYCEHCGDCDQYVGEANTKKEFIELFEPFDDKGYSTSLFRYAKEYVLKQAEELFGSQTREILPQTGNGIVYSKTNISVKKPAEHGRWLRGEDSWLLVCSECSVEVDKENAIYGEGELNYCPNCGSKNG